MNLSQLRLFYVLSFVLSCTLMTRLLPSVSFADVRMMLFSLLAFSAYSALYLVPFYLLGRLLLRFTDKVTPHFLLGVGSLGMLQNLLYSDGTIFSLYGFHINGFVLNLVMTPGGLDSMGGGADTVLYFALIIVGLFGAQALLFWLARNGQGLAAQVSRRWKGMMIALLAAFIIQGLSYGISDLTAKSEVLNVSDSIPLYQPVKIRSIGAALGYRRPTEKKIALEDTHGRVNYPLSPLVVQPPEKPLNIIWLVSESLRGDMLNEEIMPATWAFAQQQGLRFTNHYSGGNGTRMGMFSLFSGLSGNYWFSFLHEERGAALIDVLMQQNYQLRLFTSQSFSYPEFDRTLFTKVPKQNMLADNVDSGWVSDQRNVGRVLDFLKTRDTSKPFMVFMFFESPHAKYYFPESSVIRQDYLQDMNYATMSVDNLKENIHLIKNRYINSVHHLDQQWGRIWEYVQQAGLLENTVIIATGDHGEEFMEKGRWGHNSEFTEEQVKPPLVMWVPGQSPRVDDRLSSHMDVTATLMPLLGVKNPASDYSLGFSLLDAPARDFTIISDWDRIAYVDKDAKIYVPFSAKGFWKQRLTDVNDKQIDNPEQILDAKQAQIRQVMQKISRFTERKAAM